MKAQKTRLFWGSESATEIGLGIWAGMSRFPQLAPCQSPSPPAPLTETFTRISAVATANQIESFPYGPRQPSLHFHVLSRPFDSAEAVVPASRARYDSRERLVSFWPNQIRLAPTGRETMGPTMSCRSGNKCWEKVIGITVLCRTEEDTKPHSTSAQ